MISVIIPLYNKERQIRATLESVLRQSYTDYEIVVVDDGSTDGSASVVESIQDARLRLIRQENGGVSAARNRGIREAWGEYVAFLDADDLWESDFLKTLHQLSVLYPDCSVYACNYDFVSPDGTHRPTIIRRLPFTGEQGILSNYFEVASCSHPPICSISLMVKKEAMQAIGGFPIGISHGEDLLTWASLACQYQIAYSRRVMSHYVLRSSHSVQTKPVNIPQEDLVGQALIKLCKCHNTKGMKVYIAHWYKIRSSLFLRGSEPRNALKNILRSIFFYPFNPKIYVYLFMLLLPERTRVKLFTHLSS